MTNRFDAAAVTWDENPISQNLSKAIQQELGKCLILKPDMHVLDYGTGTGSLIIPLVANVAHITGMDNSEGMLTVLQNKLTQSNIDNVQLIQHNIDFEQLPLQTFDIVLSAMTMHHISNTKDFLEKCYASLKEGGQIAIIDLITEDGTFHSEPDETIKFLGFDMSYLESLAQSIGFKNVSVSEFYAIYREKNQKNYPVFMLYALK